MDFWIEDNLKEDSQINTFSTISEKNMMRFVLLGSPLDAKRTIYFAYSQNIFTEHYHCINMIRTSNNIDYYLIVVCS